MNTSAATPPANLLQDRVILVTGAGQGIGRMAALAYAAQGATVILHGRSAEKLEKVYDEIEAAGGPQAVIYPFDFLKASEAELKAMAEAIGAQLGRLDGILHNAAWLSNLTPLESESLDHWTKTLRANLTIPFGLTRACLPLLKAAPDAAILMTSDHHGSEASAYWGAFAIAKAGVESLVRMWAQELTVFPNVRINALIPGPVQSPQRLRTHPGEKRDSLPPAETLLPAWLYWMGPESTGKSGNIVDLRQNA